MKKLFITALLLLTVRTSARAQTNAKIESELVAALKEMQKYSIYNGVYDEDEKLTKAQDVFEEKLLKYTKISSTLNYKFPALNKLMYNATSEDRKFRVYSWDTEDGGTMHNYSVVYQYEGADGKVYSRASETSANEEDAGNGSLAYAIYPIDTKTGKIYAVCTTSVATTTDHYDTADLFKIEGGNLIDKIKLFKTKSGLTDSIGFEYDFYSVADWNGRPLKLIQFDKATQTIKIPVVIADEKSPLGRVTNRFISYRFDGTYFVKVK